MKIQSWLLLSATNFPIKNLSIWSLKQLGPNNVVSKLKMHLMALVRKLKAEEKIARESNHNKECVTQVIHAESNELLAGARLKKKSHKCKELKRES